MGITEFAENILNKEMEIEFFAATDFENLIQCLI